MPSSLPYDVTGPCSNLSSPAPSPPGNGRANLAPPPLLPALPEQEPKGWAQTPTINLDNSYSDNINDIDNIIDEDEGEEEEEGRGNLTGTSRGGQAERHVLPEEPETEQQCGNAAATDAALKNITLVNILIVVLLVVVIAANINEGNLQNNG